MARADQLARDAWEMYPGPRPDWDDLSEKMQAALAYIALFVEAKVKMDHRELCDAALALADAPCPSPYAIRTHEERCERVRNCLRRGLNDQS